MLRRELTLWFLILSLLAGLWATSAHSAEHVATEAHAEVCAICVLGAGLSGALPTAAFLLFLLALALAPVLAPARAPSRAHRALPRARGPPMFLA